MAESSIKSSCETIERFFSDSVSKRFIIPDYQRPYSWGDDQIITLFDDLTTFIEESRGKDEQKYFLGSVVTYENAAGELEVIDGQQRITSICLLLRFLYEKYKSTTETSTQKLVSRIEACLWNVDYEKDSFDETKTLIESRAVADDKSAVLNEILVSGNADLKAKDHYSQNFLKFKELWENYILNNSEKINTFLNMLLHSVIMLPIESTDEDFALRIFSTLNDRGLPLSDSDIFKAKCYGFCKTTEEKNTFVKKWKELEDQADEAKVGIQSLFYYYMFYLRAIQDDKKTTIPGLRKYFSSNDYEALKSSDLLENLATILNLWKVVNIGLEIENEPWSNNQDILKMLDILSSYTNDYWKYPVSIFYLKHHNLDSFEVDFLRFLKKFTAKLVKYYVEIPTISHIKAEILKFDVAILESSKPSFEAFKNDIDVEIDVYRTRIITQSNKQFTRMLLKIISYCNDKQKELLPKYWEIEHIFPQTWDDHFFLKEEDGITKVFVEDLIEHLGNKVPFEKVLNIKASNGFFNTKKIAYSDSKIADVLTIKDKNDDWTFNNIQTRDVEIVKLLSAKLNEWEKEMSESSDALLKNPSYLKWQKMLEEGAISEEEFNVLVNALLK